MSHPPQPGQSPYESYPSGDGAYGSYGQQPYGFGSEFGSGGYGGYGSYPSYDGYHELPTLPRGAGPWRRLGAHIIDAFIVAIVVTILAQFYMPAPALPQTQADMTSFTPQLMDYALQISVLNAVVFFIYNMVLQTTDFSTVGKRLVGIQVRDQDGSRLSYGKSALRNVWLFAAVIPLVSWIAPLLRMAIFFVMFTGDHTQGLNDKWAKTRVFLR